MTMSTLIDTNVLIDVTAGSGRWFSWSARRLAEVADQERVVINQVVFAEASMRFESFEDFQQLIDSAGVGCESLPWKGAFEAGSAFLAYRRQGGLRDTILPDFLIGAHARAGNHRILTRDPRRYRAYFPDVEIIAPDTHP
jgi:predicted nucleic acid-binding protein